MNTQQSSHPYDSRPIIALHLSDAYHKYCKTPLESERLVREAFSSLLPVRSRKIPNPGVDIHRDGEVNCLNCPPSCLIRFITQVAHQLKSVPNGPEPSTTTARVFSALG